MKLRRAVVDDAAAFMRVKAALPMPRDLEATQGGFLLGTDFETYARHIEHDIVWVLEAAGCVVGFGVALPWETLRQTDVWQKRDNVRLNAAGATIAFPERPAYLEQLAVLLQARASGWYLGYRLICEALRDHEDGLLTTTVERPVTNTAVLPYLRTAGFQRVGAITETYPVVGEIESSVHYLSQAAFAHSTSSALFTRGLARAERQGMVLRR